MLEKLSPFPYPLWPERFEAVTENRLNWELPPWSELYREARVQGVDINLVEQFSDLPSVHKWVNRIGNALTRVSRLNAHEVTELLFFEVHTRFALLRWKHYGHKVYVVDPGTFTLMVNTELPKMPSKYLTSTIPSFYLKFPEGVFRHQVRSDSSLRLDVMRPVADIQPVEGVMMNFSTLDVSAPSRELLYIAVGRSTQTHGADNGVYVRRTLGEYTLPEFVIREQKWDGSPQTGGTKYSDFIDEGEENFRTLIPRLLLNFCLYLTNEHPQLTPVGPCPPPKHQREHKQRRAARRHSSLGYLYVHGPKERHMQGPATGRTWRLDHKVWVRPHWRMQAYGPDHAYRKNILIREHMRGPLLPDPGTTVQKVQPAERK